MKFEIIDNKLREVGLRFSNPTIKRIKNKWWFELRIECDTKQYLNGYIHYRYRNESHDDYYSIGHFIASGSNLNKLVTVLFERIKSKKVIYQHCNMVDDEVIWTQSILTWDEVEKRFIKN